MEQTKENDLVQERERVSWYWDDIVTCRQQEWLRKQAYEPGLACQSRIFEISFPSAMSMNVKGADEDDLNTPEEAEDAEKERSLP